MGVKLWALVLAFLAAGPAWAGEPVVVRIGTDVDVQSMDPRLQRDTTGYRINNLLYDGLVQLDASLNPVPDLAVKWEQPDPKTWVFTLRPDATFADGTKVTAEDVVYTFTTMLDPKLNARFRSLYEPIDAVEAVGADQVRFRLKAPYAPLLSYMDLGIVPKHAVEAGRDLNAAPLGSGPFRFVRWDRGSRVVLAANDGYFGGRPKVDEVDVVVVPDNTARAQALESGDLDVVMSPLSPQDVHRLAGDKRFGWTHLPGISITDLNFNTANPVLADPKVRHAIAMLIDQKTIVEQIYGGIDVPATSLLIPSLKASYTADVTQPAYDPAGAKRLLADDGWKPGPGGVLTKDGRRLAFTLSTHSEDPNRVQTVEFLQNAFQDAGLDVKTLVTDWPAFIGNTQVGKYDAAYFGWTILVDPDRAMFSQLSTGGSTNFGKYSNAQVDAALNRGRTVSDPGERKAAYDDAARIIADEAPYYVMSYAGFDAFADGKTAGFVPDARGFLRSLAVH